MATRMQNVKARNIDEYIAAFPRDTQRLLEEVRTTIRRAAPHAEEAIKYAIPAFTLHGNLIFFAAFKTHIGLYPAPRGAEQFKKVLERYEGGKGTVQFPLDEPLPLSLITKIVKYRVKENLEKMKAKTK